MMLYEIIQWTLYVIVLDWIWTNAGMFLAKYNITDRNTIQEKRMPIFAGGFFGCFLSCFFSEQVLGGMVPVIGALITVIRACAQPAQTLAAGWDVHVQPTLQQLNDAGMGDFLLLVAISALVVITLRLVASTKLEDNLFTNILQRTAADWSDPLVHPQLLVTFSIAEAVLYFYADQIIDGIVYVLALMDNDWISVGKVAWFIAMNGLMAKAIRWYSSVPLEKPDKYFITQHDAQGVYKIWTNQFFIAGFFAFNFNPYIDFAPIMVDCSLACVETVRALVNSTMAFGSEINVAGISLNRIVVVILVDIALYNIMLLAYRKYISWLSAKGDKYRAQLEQELHDYNFYSSRRGFAKVNITAIFNVIFMVACVENHVAIKTQCQTFLRTTHSMAQAASHSAKSAYWSLQWDLIPIDQESSFGNETEPSAANLTAPSVVETVPSPPPQLYSPFENIELVQSWMTPSYLDENQGVALFALHEFWFPAADEAEIHEIEEHVADAGCCKQDDLTCRIKAIAIDYVPELAPYFIDETSNAESNEEDTEPAGDAPPDFAGFVVRYEHSIFRLQEIAEPIVPKKPILLKRAEFGDLTPSASDIPRCNRWIASWLPVVSSLEYHQCMRTSRINMTPSPERPVSTTDQGSFSDNGTEDNSSAPINSSSAQVPPALSAAKESDPADASDPTHVQASPDLAPALSTVLSVATDGQSPDDGTGESPPSNNEIAADPVRVCSDNDSLWDVASDALRLIQTYVQENLKSDTKQTPKTDPTLLGDPFTPDSHSLP